MNDNNNTEPHGGALVNLVVDDERSAILKDIVLNLPDITLNDRQLCDLELLATGAFSPLTGFMNRSDYESVFGSITPRYFVQLSSGSIAGYRRA